MDTTTAAAFGRRSAQPSRAQQLIAMTPGCKPKVAPAPVNPVERALDRVFLWLPNEQKPGFSAVFVVALRQAVLPLILMLGLFAVGGISLKSLLPGSPQTGAGVILTAYVVGSIALVQELSRYAFIRRADIPVKSALLFAAVVMVSIVVVFHDAPYTMAWMAAAQGAASLAMLFTRVFKGQRMWIVAAIVVCQTVLAVAMPQWTPRPDAPTAAAAAPEALGPGLQG
jgi:hypothetical protein